MSRPTFRIFLTVRNFEVLFFFFHRYEKAPGKFAGDVKIQIRTPEMALFGRKMCVSRET